MVVFGKVGFGQSSFVSMKYGDRFRVHRKLTNMGIGLQQVGSYQSLQSDESKVFLYNLLNGSENLVGHLERYAASVVSIIEFGRRIRTPEDPIITEAVALMQHAAELNVPGKSFPMLMETSPSMLIPKPYCMLLRLYGSSREIPQVDGTMEERGWPSKS
jgi:hypothetical protein